MYNPQYNNFQTRSIYDLDKDERNIKKNKNVIIDVSGTKYDLVRTVANYFEWF